LSDAHHEQASTGLEDRLVAGAVRAAAQLEAPAIDVAPGAGGEFLNDGPDV